MVKEDSDSMFLHLLTNHLLLTQSILPAPTYLIGELELFAVWCLRYEYYTLLKYSCLPILVPPSECLLQTYNTLVFGCKVVIS